MYKFYSIIIFVVMAVFASCENDDTDFSHIIDGAEVEVKDIEFDSTPLDEGVENIPSDDNDYVENSDFYSVVKVDYRGMTAVVSGDVDMVTYLSKVHMSLSILIGTTSSMYLRVRVITVRSKFTATTK